MPRIPIIEQTTNVSTSTPTTQAQGVQVVSPIGNAGAIASQGFDYQQQHLQKRNEDMEIANMPTSDAALHWDQYLTDAPKNFVNGGNVKNDDGTEVGFRGKAQEEFDKWGTEFIAKTTDGRPRQYATEFVQRLRTHTLEKAIGMEARANLDNKVNVADGDRKKWASLAAKAGPDGIDGILEQAKIKIANSGFDQETRNKVATQTTQVIVAAGFQGYLERDPAGAKAALLQRYGIDPTAPPSVPGQGAQPSVSMAGDPSLPAGMRNNNPGNIKYTGQPGTTPSVNKDQGGSQAVYASPEQGMGAMFSLALKKYDGGKTTANSLIASEGGWTLGNTQAAANIAKTMGVSPDADLNLRDPAMLKSFARALMLQEHGPASRKYSDGMISSVADTILSGGKIAAPPAGAGRGGVNPPAVAGAPDAPIASPALMISPALAKLVDQLPTESLPGWISHATTQVNQQQALARNSIEQTIRDQTTQAMTTGSVGHPLTEDQFVQAYGAADGQRKYREEYQPMMDLGAAVAHTFSMPDSQQDATLASMKPVPDSHGFEVAQRRYETYAQAVNAVRSQRQKDPIGFAIQQKVSGIAPLDMSTPDTMAAGMSTRLPQAQAVSQMFNTPLQMLSAGESEGLRKGFQQMAGGQQGDYLLALNRKMNNPAAFRALVQQVSPDSPETQVAAALLSNNDQVVVRSHWFKPDETLQAKDVANWILIGRHLINPTSDDKKTDGKERGWSMPKDADMLQAFNKEVGNAFAGNAQAYRDTYQAVRAYYAGKASFMGKADSQINPDQTLMAEAVKGVTGGVADVGGSKVLMPWGMKESDFISAKDKAASVAFAANGITGYQANPAAYTMMGAGDGKYYMLNGTEPVRNKITGEKVIVDILNNGAPAAAAAPVVPTAAPSRVPVGKGTQGVMPTGKHR